MSDEQRRQMEQMGMMLEGEDNPLAGVFGQMADVPGLGDDGTVTVAISGHRPDSPDVRTDQVLGIDLLLEDVSDPAALTGKRMPAEVYYIPEGSGGMAPDVLYVSGEGGGMGAVTLDRLEIDEGGGHASGHFEAS